MAASPARRARQLSWLSLVWMGPRGRDRDHRRDRGRLDRSDRLRHRLGDRGVWPAWSSSGASPAVAFALTRRRRPRAEAGRDPVLHPRATTSPMRQIRHLAGAEHPDVSVPRDGARRPPSLDRNAPCSAAPSRRWPAGSGSPRPRTARAPENLLCAILASAVLPRPCGQPLFGWWWLDPIAAPRHRRRRRARGVWRPRARRAVARWFRTSIQPTPAIRLLRAPWPSATELRPLLGRGWFATQNVRIPSARRVQPANSSRLSAEPLPREVLPQPTSIEAGLRSRAALLLRISGFSMRSR